MEFVTAIDNAVSGIRKFKEFVIAIDIAVPGIRQSRNL